MIMIVYNNYQVENSYHAAYRYIQFSPSVIGTLFQNVYMTSVIHLKYMFDAFRLQVYFDC